MRIAIVGVVMFVISGLIHLYLGKRLVWDTLPPGRARKVGLGIVVFLAALVPATLVSTRAGVSWLAWPGYLWVALMFYLLVVLLLLEVPLLVTRLLWRGGSSRAVAAGASETVAAGSSRAVAARSPETVAAGASEAVAAPVIDGSLETVGAPRAGELAEPVRPAGVFGPPEGGGPPDPGAPSGVPPGEGFDRRTVLARGAAIFAGLTAAGITGYGMRTALAPPRIDRVRIPIAKLPRRLDGLRIATVSDIHLGPLRQRAHTARIVEIINGLDADVVAVVGDLVDGTVEELGPAAAPLADLRSRHGSFFVTGNHEYFSGVEGWLDELPRLGLRLLQNERVEIDGIDLAGVNDVTAPGRWAPDYAAALGDRDTSRPVVLLAHQPAAALNIADYDVDLQLSGHTHGGQMVPFNVLVGLAQPVVSGLGEVDGTPVYVTNGAGFWGPPVRVGAPPQVTLVELRAP